MITDEYRQPRYELPRTQEREQERPIQEMDMSKDEEIIRAIVKGREDAWNAGDARGFGKAFAEDVDYVVINGMYLKGRDAIDAGHQQIFDTIYKGSNLRATIEDIRFIRPDVAAVRVQSHLVYSQGEMHGRSTWVLSKDDGEWQIVAFHNTPIQAR